MDQNYLHIHFIHFVNVYLFYYYFLIIVIYEEYVPLIVASRAGHLDVVRYLLSKGAKIEITRKSSKVCKQTKLLFSKKINFLH